MQRFDVRQTVIHVEDQVSGRARGFATGGWAVVKHDNAPAFLAEQVRGGESSDTGSHDAYIAGRVLNQPGTGGGLGGGHPERDGPAVVGLHATDVAPAACPREVSKRGLMVAGKMSAQKKSHRYIGWLLFFPPVVPVVRSVSRVGGIANGKMKIR